MIKKKSVLAQARSWAVKKKLFGTQAFLRYVILRFTENLNQVSHDFVFKGGNLLWVYIDTPRATIDLDLVTLSENSHTEVKSLLEQACARDKEIRYSILDFKKIEQEEKLGASVTIGYSTNQGASNRFDIDIVYALSTDFKKIASPLGTEKTILSATLENIIVDKLAACHRFASGNTRMKDFDDLWRISKSGVDIHTSELKKLLLKRKINPNLNTAWIGTDMKRAWKSHSSKYRDLPAQLELLFSEVNQWLKSLMI